MFDVTFQIITFLVYLFVLLIGISVLVIAVLFVRDGLANRERGPQEFSRHRPVPNPV